MGAGNGVMYRSLSKPQTQNVSERHRKKQRCVVFGFIGFEAEMGVPSQFDQAGNSKGTTTSRINMNIK